MYGIRAPRISARALYPVFAKTAAFIVAVFAFFVVSVMPALAQDVVGSGNAAELAAAAGLPTGDLATIVGRIINGFLGLLGVVAVVLIIYAGYLWMTSAGNEEQIARAKSILKNAVIGLVLIFSSWAIVSFLFRTLEEAGSGIGGSVAPGSRFNTLFSDTRGTDALGNGIIEYHYPEPGQVGVPRNTKLSITFKKPVVLSSVIKNYDDAGTYTLADDRLCPGAVPCPTAPLVSSIVPAPTFELNVDNVRLIPNGDLGDAGSGDADTQFTSRYPLERSVASPAPTVKVTAVPAEFDENVGQTIVFKPVTPIGSPSGDVNYRVALRGGETGVKVWIASQTDGTATVAAALPRPYADGGYYWGFTTSTTIDVTPPKIVSVVPVAPRTPGVPEGTIVDRNQLLQVYFDEAVDPTSASGVIGTGGGFTNVEVRAQCLPGAFPATCDFNNGQEGVVDGTLSIGNRYRTIEFAPSAPCEGVATNSCGETVYCLPKNVALTVKVRAAAVGAEAPQASEDNGVVDMVDNSLDGDGDGKAKGTQGITEFYWNDPQPAGARADVNDSVRIAQRVGSNVDLVAPRIIALDPPSPPPEGLAHPDGPSKIPVGLEPSVMFSKTMSIASMRTGGFDETNGSYRIASSTLVLRSRECAKTNVDECPIPPTNCACTFVEPPPFFIDAGLPAERPVGSGKYVTRVAFRHPSRAFYTANDLGYTEADVENYPDNIPIYAPIVRAKVRDTKQNCFWPSVYRPEDAGGECRPGSGQTSCCDRTAVGDGGFLSTCAP